MSRRRARTIAALGLTAVLCLGAGASQAEVVQKAGLRVSFEAKVSPRALPRRGVAPIAVTLGGKIASTSRAKAPPQLRTIRIAINRNGRLDPSGLPVCRYDEIQPATTANAIAACGKAKVGVGSFSANVVIPEQSPFPSDGEVVVFNGREGGRPVLFAHVYGTKPVPTSYTLPLRISQARGQFATVLEASLPQVTSKVAFVTGLSLTLDRRLLSAGCPAPSGFPGASFPLAQVSFGFAGGKGLAATLVRSCRAR